MTALEFAECFYYFVVSMIAISLFVGALILIHDIATGRYVHWGYWRRMLNSKPDQFQDGR